MHTADPKQAKTWHFDHIDPAHCHTNAFLHGAGNRGRQIVYQGSVGTEVSLIGDARLWLRCRARQLPRLLCRRCFGRSDASRR